MIKLFVTKFQFIVMNIFCHQLSNHFLKIYLLFIIIIFVIILLYIEEKYKL